MSAELCLLGIGISSSFSSWMNAKDTFGSSDLIALEVVQDCHLIPLNPVFFRATIGSSCSCSSPNSGRDFVMSQTAQTTDTVRRVFSPVLAQGRVQAVLNWDPHLHKGNACASKRTYVVSQVGLFAPMVPNRILDIVTRFLLLLGYFHPSF